MLSERWRASDSTDPTSIRCSATACSSAAQRHVDTIDPSSPRDALLDAAHIIGDGEALGTFHPLHENQDRQGLLGLQLKQGSADARWYRIEK
jgi:hypothetical protein